MKKYISPSVTESPAISLTAGKSATSEFASGFMKGFGFGSPRIIPETSLFLEAISE